MASTTNSDVVEMDPNQIGKEATFNTAIQALEMMINAELDVQVDDGSHNSPYTFTYQVGDEPSAVKTALRFMFLNLKGALSADWQGIFPLGKRTVFVASNLTTGGKNVILKVTGKTGVTIPAGQAFWCLLNGTDVVQVNIVPASGSQPWEVMNFIDGKPTAGLVVMRWIAARTITFPANFSSNQMKAATPAAGSCYFSINKNGSEVGRATFTGGNASPTWTSTGGTTVVFNAGDQMTFVAPAIQDANLADIDWTFVGTR